jgi:tRNA threonylcarbamoyladenosine biosynthesis protein TsaB
VLCGKFTPNHKTINHEAMNILAIETATELCSVALLTEHGIATREATGVRQHAEFVLPFVEQLLRETGVDKKQLSAIAFGRGPGAFTGVRLAVSVAQGLSFALDIPAIGISTLAAIAQQGFEQSQHQALYATLDARMGELYAARFVRGAPCLPQLPGLAQLKGLAQLQGTEQLLQPAQLQPLAGEVLCGSGAVCYATHFQAHEILPAVPAARAIATLAHAEFLAGRMLTAREAMPVYIRDKVAQTISERAAAKAANAR